MRLRLFQIIQRAQEGDQVSRWYDFFIVTVAFLSIVPLMFKDNISPEVSTFMNAVDIVTVYILFADYVFRWVTHDIRTGDGKKAFLLYPFTPMAIIDLLSILPSITILHNGFKFLRILRIVRILRMFNGLTIVTNVFIRERKTLLSVVFFIVVYTFTIALVMFSVEPNTFDNFLDALYWSTTALATIGYGDIYPVTNFGKLIASISSIVGICVIAFPAGIITAGYITQLNKAKNEGREYFALPVKHTKSYKGKPITSYKSIWAYFKSNRKVKVYAIVMFILVVVSALIVITNLEIPCFSPFDCLGVLIASVLLEPCAAIIIGLVSDLIYAISINTAGGILFFGTTAMYICCYGILCRRDKKITIKTIAGIFFVSVILTTIYEFLISYIIYSENTIDSEYLFYDKVIEVSNAFNINNLAICALIYQFGSKVISTTIGLIGIFIVRKFIFDSVLDPSRYFAKSKKYKYKIYKRKKNEQSYIRSWLENNDEHEDLDVIEQVVQEGKRSIESSKKRIRTKREEIQEMQQQVEENLENIEQTKEEIKQHEEDIDIKKRAVRRVKRKAVVESIKPGNDDEQEIKL
ncbi:MAG: ion transporter [Coriobacteriia bacterium]|nr:ion transporter [Coriobacteriia bacterium]